MAGLRVSQLPVFALKSFEAGAANREHVGAAFGHLLMRRRSGLLGFHQVAATLRRVDGR
jgi:hypothetical protein